MTSRVRGDALADAGRALAGLGADGLHGPTSAEFAAEVAREHPARDVFTAATADAAAACGVPSPGALAEDVYANFVWTHFVCKLLMTARPAEVIDHVLARTDLRELAAAEAAGPSILSGFHYTGFPLMALALAMSPSAPLITKARVDVLEGDAGNKHDDHVVYLSDRSAPLRMTRALKGGRSVWAMPDVVLPGVRTAEARFLGHAMRVGAGLGTIARLSGRPCTPLFWTMTGPDAVLRTGAPIPAAARSEDDVIQDLVSAQADFISRNPAHWLEWYAVLDEAPRLRARVKAGNDRIWARLARALD